MIGSWVIMEGWWEEGKSVPECPSFPLYKVGSVAQGFESLTGCLAWQGERPGHWFRVDHRRPGGV